MFLLFCISYVPTCVASVLARQPPFPSGVVLPRRKLAVISDMGFGVHTDCCGVGTKCNVTCIAGILRYRYQPLINGYLDLSLKGN